MGFAVAWIAVSGKEPARVLEVLGLTRTGVTEEFPDSKISCALLPGSWFLIFIHDYGSPMVSEHALSALSSSCHVVACQVEEHAMVASVAAYADGAQVWRVEHDAQQDIYHLASSGLLPPQLQEIHAGLKKQQDEEGGADAGVDYIFDVPVMLAESIVGYRHDKDIEAPDPLRFEVLRQDSNASKPRPWWKVW